MSRHRDVRSMKYTDEYSGYDDDYGHSVEDDYCTSPSVEQFLFDRNKQTNMSSFIAPPDIDEANEDVEENAEAEYIKPELSDLDNAKLVSCLEAVRDVVGVTSSDAALTEIIIKSNFDVEVALNAILMESPEKTSNETEVANKDQLDTNPGAKLIVKPVKLTSVNAIKVVPAATGTVVKGFDVKGTESKVNLLSSTFASPRSLSPASGRNSPDPRKKDDRGQKKFGVSGQDVTAGCPSPRSGSGRATPEIDARKKTKEEKRDAREIYKTSRGDCKEQLHLVVVGHVDAGKSTLLGRLLFELGRVSPRLMHKYQQESKKIGKQSFAFAWIFDETGEERERGITMDIGYSTFETATKSVTLLDAPGHKDFIPNMITGATQADVSLLVVDATRGEFETGFDNGGQTREHALLLRSLGVSQVAVIVNKLDTVDWSKDRFDEIVDQMSVFLKQAGFKDNVPFVPCSGLSGENITTKPKAEALASWFKGHTVLSVIDSFKCPERPIDKPLRLSVNDVFKGTGSGFCVSGHIETGMCAVGDKVLLLPSNEAAIVKGLQSDDVSITNGFAGDHVALTLSGIEQQNVGIGDIISSIHNSVPVTMRFQAHVVIFAVSIPVTKGLPVVLHHQSLVEPAVITKLIAQVHKSTGEVTKKKPRCLPKNTSAIIEIQTQRQICMELYRDVKQLGRVMLRVAGATIAAGLVTKIK